MGEYTAAEYMRVETDRDTWRRTAEHLDAQLTGLRGLTRDLAIHMDRELGSVPLWARIRLDEQAISWRCGPDRDLHVAKARARP